MESHYYEIEKNGKWFHGFLKVSSDSEALERLAQEKIGYLLKLYDETVLIDDVDKEVII